MKKIKNFSQKEENCLQLINKDPQNPLHFGQLGKLYFLNQDYPRAVEAYRQGLKLEPHNISLLFNLAVTREAQEQIEQAKELYLQILDLDCENQPAQERLDKITSF